MCSPTSSGTTEPSDKVVPVVVDLVAVSLPVRNATSKLLFEPTVGGGSFSALSFSISDVSDPAIVPSIFDLKCSSSWGTSKNRGNLTQITVLVAKEKNMWSRQSSDFHLNG